jgi:lipid-binding SYLF domain-containing protein
MHCARPKRYLLCLITAGHWVWWCRRPGSAGSQACTWTGPVFYNIGAINAGLQVGVELGSTTFLMITDKALEGFRKENNFSLSADTGFTIVNFPLAGPPVGVAVALRYGAHANGMYGI